MAQDNQFEESLDRLVSSLRGDLTAALQRREAEVTQRNTAERETAVRQAAETARQETLEQLARLRQAAHEQIEAAKRAAQAEAAARARAEAQVEDVRRIGRSQVEEVQQTLGDRISALMRELDESRREVAARRHELDSARGASAMSLADLVRGVHAVDEAESLTGVLQRLIDSARHHSKGASILLVRDAGLKEWTGAGSESRLRINERGMSVASNSASERRRVESETAIAFPVSVGGEVVAVLYAEVDDALSPQRRISKDALDTLTRHAGRVLETITVQQAAGLRPLRRDSTGGRFGQAAGDQFP